MRLKGRFSNPEYRRILERINDHRRSTAGLEPAERTVRVPRQRQTRLTDEQVDEAVKAYRAGATLTQLGVRFGVSDQTVAAHLERRGVPRRQPQRMTRAQITQARKLHEEGWSYAAIGRELGFTGNTVKKEVRTKEWR